MSTSDSLPHPVSIQAVLEGITRGGVDMMRKTVPRTLTEEVFTAQMAQPRNAMHFSAYARSWDRMSSVRLSVTLVICDHIGWKSWKLIAQTISPTPSLIVPKGDPPTPRGTWGNLGETRGGVGEKWHTGEQKR